MHRIEFNEKTKRWSTHKIRPCKVCAVCQTPGLSLNSAGPGHKFRLVSASLPRWRSDLLLLESPLSLSAIDSNGCEDVFVTFPWEEAAVLGVCVCVCVCVCVRVCVRVCVCVRRERGL